jgi:hypothetical protein
MAENMMRTPIASLKYKNFSTCLTPRIGAGAHCRRIGGMGWVTSRPAGDLKKLSVEIAILNSSPRPVYDRRLTGQTQARLVKMGIYEQVNLVAQ